MPTSHDAAPGAHSRSRRPGKRVLTAVISALTALAVACGGGATGGTASPPAAAAVTTPSPEEQAMTPVADGATGGEYGVDGPAPPPAVDRAVASVAARDIVFDTFGGPPLRLSEATTAQVASLFNRIRPVYRAEYEPASGGDWLNESDLVLGYSGREQAYAYPVKFLNFHELVNETIDGVPLLISYCPLCASGVVFDRRVDGRELVFGNTSALYQNDLVMVDHETGTYWFQTGGEGVVGPLTGSRLAPLPSMTITWAEWKKLYPDTLILSRDQGFPIPPARYERDPFGGYGESVARGRYPFPVDESLVSDRLGPADIVLTVLAGDEEKAYPLEVLGHFAANDVVGGQPVVVFSSDQGPVGVAFSRVTGGRTLTFEASDAGEFTDTETGSTWDLRGVAVGGELRGERLTPLPTRRAFWFSISIMDADIEIFSPGTGPG